MSTAADDLAPHETPVTELSDGACWQLLAAHSVGRLAVTATDGDPDLFPLDFLVHDGSLYMRSAPGSKLMDIAAHPAVALEIDGTDEGERWSVVVRGRAERLAFDTEIVGSGVLSLRSSNPTSKHNYLRLVPTAITGRSFRTT